MHNVSEGQKKNQYKNGKRNIRISAWVLVSAQRGVPILRHWAAAFIIIIIIYKMITWPRPRILSNQIFDLNGSRESVWLILGPFRTTVFPPSGTRALKNASRAGAWGVIRSSADACRSTSPARRACAMQRAGKNEEKETEKEREEWAGDAIASLVEPTREQDTRLAYWQFTTWS